MICKHFLIVPDSFIGGSKPRCSILNSGSYKRQKMLLLGCHCLEMSNTCRDILIFLKQFGRFQAIAIKNLIYQEIRQTFDNEYIENFDDMIESIVYPAFFRRFRKRYLTMKNELKIGFPKGLRIRTFESCVDDGPNCIVALNTMNELLLKVFRTFYVLNKDIMSSTKSSSISRKRHKGTLVANLNFLLEETSDNIKPPKTAFSKLQNDLSKLGRLITSSKIFTAPEIVQLLGFTQALGAGNVKKTNLLVFNQLSQIKEACDIHHLHKKWEDYLNKISNRLKGKISILQLFYLVYKFSKTDHNEKLYMSF